MTTFDIISATENQNDLEIFNDALYFEHQGIWAYDLDDNSLKMQIPMVPSTFVSKL